MSSWGLAQTIDRVGRVRFEAWCEARKRTPWARNLSPHACELAAKQGNPEAKAVIEKMTVLLVKRRLGV